VVSHSTNTFPVPRSSMKSTTLFQLSSLGLCLISLIAPIRAEDAAKPGAEGGKPSPEVMQKLLEKFDADGDGKLNAEEGAAAKQAMAERRGEGGGGDGKAEMFKRFDKDGDGKLNADEGKAAREAMEQHRKEEMLKRFEQRWRRQTRFPRRKSGERRDGATAERRDAEALRVRIAMANSTLAKRRRRKKRC